MEVSGGCQRHRVAVMHQVPHAGAGARRAGRRDGSDGNRPAVKPRRVSSATARASPSAICIVVLVVGASPIGQASGAVGSSSATSAAWARAESARAVTATSGRAKRREWRDEIGEFRGFSGVGEGQDGVSGDQHPEIAVGGFGGMDEIVPAFQWRTG